MLAECQALRLYAGTNTACVAESLSPASLIGNPYKSITPDGKFQGLLGSILDLLGRTEFSCPGPATVAYTEYYHPGRTA